MTVSLQYCQFGQAPVRWSDLYISWLRKQRQIWLLFVFPSESLPGQRQAGDMMQNMIMGHMERTFQRLHFRCCTTIPTVSSKPLAFPQMACRKSLTTSDVSS